jgi:bacteriocin-like protein
MKKMMEMFSLETLSKNEMKGISGGGCTLTIDYGSDCGNSVVSTHGSEAEVRYAIRDGKKKPGYSGYNFSCHQE